MRSREGDPVQRRATRDASFRSRGALPAVLALAAVGVLLGPRIFARTAPDRIPAVSASSEGRATTTLDGARVGYPKGRWRLAQPSELEQVTLWVSHIVIAHKDSNPSAEFHLRPVGWNPDPPNPDRSPEAAQETAVNLAARLARRPEDFEAAARQFSDDIVTRDAGGSLGGVRATQLPPVYLDALSTLHPGEVSHVVRTPLGFSILMQRRPSGDEEISAKRLLFRHRDAFASPSDGKATRTRGEALVAAQRAVKKLRSGAVAFDALLPESDSASSRPTGDIGVWTLRAPGSLPRQIEALSRIQVGEISEPIETSFGFEVLQRTEVTPRSRYAMQSIQLLIESKASGEDGGAASDPGVLAESLALRLAREPGLFDEFLERYCCAPPERWSHGRGPSNIEPVLEQLAVGEIAKRPIRSGWHYYIPKRLDPATLPEDPAPQYELPAPRGAQLSPMVEAGNGAFLAQRTRELAQEALASLALPPSQSAELSRIFEELAAAFEAHPGRDDGPLRVKSMEATQAAFLRTLGPTQYTRLNGVIDAWTARLILNGSP